MTEDTKGKRKEKLNCKRCGRKTCLYARQLCKTCYYQLRTKGILYLYPLIENEIKVGRKYKPTNCEHCGSYTAYPSEGKYCRSCAARKGSVSIGVAGKMIHISISRESDKEEMTNIIKQKREELKNKIYNDIINNPRKWLKKTPKSYKG